MSMIDAAIAAIEAQQAKVKARSPQWMVGEQLKDICRAEPASAELIAQDLEREAMSITKAEAKIKAFADGHKTGSFACVTPAEADRILREFYGLPALKDGENPQSAQRLTAPFAKGAGAGAGEIIDLADFF